MKLHTIFILLLATALVFGLIGIIVRDFRENYQTVEEVDTSYEKQYRYFTPIDDWLSELQNKTLSIESEEPGWKVFFKSLIAIPIVGIRTTVIIAKTPYYIVKILSSIVSKSKIPTEISDLVINIFGSMILGLIIFMLVRLLMKSGGPV